jgi:hypothetical protein
MAKQRVAKAQADSLLTMSRNGRVDYPKPEVESTLSGTQSFAAS